MHVTAFDGHRRLAGGALAEVALAVKHAAEGAAAGPLLIFDDATGRVVDVDLRGSDADVVARLAAANDADGAVASDPPAPPADAPAPAGGRRRGRPSLGVVAREVTLLPRHWEWLSAQPGGASVALRRLVDTARRAGADADRRRAAQEAAYRFISAMAGDLPGFEEASRALFADDRARFADHAHAWPPDVADHALRLAFPGEG
ncbi:DUF2239 family protein [Longimicrobium sp.]|uniref:DUF2239 family protein n=1 Tax=Longimicrobium sp. TaxID=2029185 RepID=UPI002E36FDE7|nr:DUF2239 family protein [Longimicrobium sp.]HEX6040620.1 DUF2239 family protein [Longimicrobium sp.]